MKLPVPTPRYDADQESLRNQILELADRQNLKRQADVEVVDPQRLILRSPDGTRWKITVSNAGVLSASAL